MPPPWMADRNSIVFVDTKGGEATGIVKMINVNTSQVTAVPDSKALFAPVASPDGRYFASASIDGQTLWLF